jgi:hypothetical protein
MANKVHWKLLNANSVQFFFSTHLLRPPRGARSTLWEPLVQPVVRHYTAWATAAPFRTYVYAPIINPQRSISWKANSRSPSLEIPRILWNTEIQYRVHKSAPLDSILNLINPVHITHYFLNHFNIILLAMPKCPKWSLVCISHYFLACYMPRHLILLDLIILITCDE